MAARPKDAAKQSRSGAAAAGVASRAPVSAAAPPICSPANSETRRRTYTTGAYPAVATAVGPDDRDERRNYRGGPARDPPASDSERRRRASCGER